MKSLAPNTLLQNRYLIVHLIGKGGMGEVYLAVDQRLGSAIALKRTLHGDNVQLGDAFEREARTLARLRHPALPKVSDHFIENENQYLVMEHISGDDLAKRLNTTQKPFPLSWVLFWADQLLDALAYLHSHEPPIIHRDIKPQNLKLTDDNNIVLLDFGLSKNSVGQTISNASGSAGSGSTGSVVGYTPHYAPMEQIRGTGTNPKSDIYSLSATLYQLLTNIVPPDALSRADFLLSGKTDPIAPINEVNNEIPKSISDVILKGMSISQDQRFSDAREMQKVLRETYAKMQSDAADKTVAFNVQDEQPAPAAESAPFLNDKTEQFSAPVLENQTASKEAMGAQTIPFGMLGNTAGEGLRTVTENKDKTEQIPNFDQTLRIDDVENLLTPQDPETKPDMLPVADSAPLQSNVKTEVFGGDFGAAEYLEKNEPAPPQDSTTDNAKKDETSAPPNFTGDKTVPFIEANKQNAEIDLAQTQYPSAFNSGAQAENFGGIAAAAETRLPTEGFSQTNPQAIPQTAPNYDSKPKQWQAQPAPVQRVPEKKKSKGLLFGILGALFGLVILAAAGGGIAWYLMNQQSNSGATNTATPSPEPSATPTPEQTPEQANTGNTSNSEVVTTNSPDNSNVNGAASPSPEQTKTVSTQPTPLTTKTITTRPTQVTTNTPRTTTPKPTTKPETKPTVRGGIIPQ